MDKHSTTMKPSQRKELIRILLIFNKIEVLAILTDTELHGLWLEDCGHTNPYKQ